MQELHKGDNHQDWHPEPPRKITMEEIKENARKFHAQAKTEELDPEYEERVRQQFEALKGRDEDIPDTIPQLDQSELRPAYELGTAIVNLRDIEQMSEEYGIDLFNRPLTDEDIASNPGIDLNKILTRFSGLSRSLAEHLTFEDVNELTQRFPKFHPEKISSIHKDNAKLILRRSGEIKLIGD